MMKKLFLLGAAGLAALSISCSDDDGGEASGEFTKPFGVTDNGTNIVASGEITANDDVEVKTVTIISGSNNITFVDILSLPAQVVSLDGKRLSGACGNLSGNQTFNFIITVTFSDDTQINAEARNVPVNCGGAAQLTSFTFTLSSGTGTTDFSYYDLDGKQGYKQTNATSDSNKDKIDLIAFASSSLGTKIFAPEFTPYPTGVFGDNESVIFEVPSEGQSDAQAALNANPINFTDSDKAGISGLISNFSGRNSTGVEIENNKVFIVETPDDGVFAVGITSSTLPATGTKTVTLKAVHIPGI